MDAYLDIETTGLSPYSDKITVIGIGLSLGERLQVVQLVDKEVTERRLTGALEGVTRLYTYNGARFDIPFVRGFLGLNLSDRLDHHDLMLDCWNRGLFGGLKAVEENLGIPRQLKGVTGLDAVNLWYRYKEHGDGKALHILLEYNKEDVENLLHLRRKLENNPMAGRPGL
ncbi:MAG: ribonuclease H-like domain-containing protein [Chloroflexi bacterium]|nr:ribonuclease H-like domain-containing protein [Chloroflexota bacterium]